LRGCNVGTPDRRDLCEYGVEIVSCSMIYIPSFIKIGSGIQKLIGGYTHRHTHIHTHIQEGDFISLLFLIE
jgi:hypothetical protein